MHLMVVIAVDFASEDLAGLVDELDVFPGAGSDESILEPAIRPFDLAFGLRREGITGVDPTVLEDPFPLRVDFVGDEIVFPPEGIAALDKAENGVRIGVVGIRDSIAEDDALQGVDMVPAGLLLNQLGIQHLTAKIIQGGDEMPFFRSIRAPSVVGRVVLDEFANIVGQDLSIVGFSLGPAEEKIMLLGPPDDRWQGGPLAVFLPEKIPDVAVVVGVERDSGVFDQFLLLPELREDVLFGLRADPSGLPGPLIGNGKLRRILPVLLEQHEEPAAADLEDVQDIGQLDLLPDVTLE
jgi:hypothetical protein